MMTQSNCKINMIVATCKIYKNEKQHFYIGLDGTIPWFDKDEMKIFKEKTNNSILIVGRKTFENLNVTSILERDNIIYVISRKNSNDDEQTQNIVYFNDINHAIFSARTSHKNIFVIGGSEIYSYFLHNRLIDTMHISIMNDTYTCNIPIPNFDEHLRNFEIKNTKECPTFIHYELEYSGKNNNLYENYYLDLLNEVIEHGDVRQTRNSITKSLFGGHFKLNLQSGFPLLTTKKMFIKGVIEELLFFIRGDTNSKNLENKGVNIWKMNTSRDFLDKMGFYDYPEGEMGPMYGYQWRNFGSQNFDQLRYVIDMINNDPFSRRIIMTDFNPIDAQKSVLYPCHSIILQFYVNENNLDMYCYNRSQDLFLGTPFNIASSALLLMIIAKITNKNPRFLEIGMGDVHIYENHINSAKKQILRIPYKFPEIILPDFKTLEDVEKLSFNDFKIVNYKHHSEIKEKMVA